MKKIFVFILIFIFVFALPLHSAFAESGDFVEIKNDNVYLFSRSYDDQTNSFDYKQKFILPISYFVKIEEEVDSLDSAYMRVSYGNVSGWILISSVKGYKKQSDVTNPYFIISDLKTISAVSLYSETTTSSAVVQNLQINSQLTFVSYIRNGASLWYYVQIDNNYGYVQAVYTNHETVPYVSYNSGTQSDDETGNKVPENKPVIEFFNNLNNNLLNWILSIVILIPTVVFVVLIFKRKTSSTNDNNDNTQVNYSSQDKERDKNDSQIYMD